jgi:hypothetical protein
MRKGLPKGEKSSKKSGWVPSWRTVLYHFTLIYLFVAFIFYVFYLYGKYAHDRASVSAFYDDATDRLKQPYHTVMWVLLAVPLLLFAGVSVVATGPGMIGFFMFLVLVMWAIGWMIDHFAALVAGVPARYITINELENTKFM